MIRLAVPEDAETVAGQRGRMFLDMGACSEVEAQAISAESVAWFEGLLRGGEYVGWLTVCDGEIVGGGGVHLREMGPVPGMCCVGRWGHIANVYVAPEHRGRGLARELMEMMLKWAAAEGIGRLTLTASRAGEGLYRSLGFSATHDMELLLRDR